MIPEFFSAFTPPRRKGTPCSISTLAASKIQGADSLFSLVIEYVLIRFEEVNRSNKKIGKGNRMILESRSLWLCHSLPLRKVFGASFRDTFSSYERGS